MVLDPNQSIRRSTSEQLTVVQAGFYYSGLAGVYERTCREIPDDGRALDRYHQALGAFGIVRQIHGTVPQASSLAQSFEEFLVSRGCPDGSPAARSRRELVAYYSDLDPQLRNTELSGQAARIADAAKAGRFEREPEEALGSIIDMMRHADKFFILVGMRLLGLISWDGDAPRVPAGFADRVREIASHKRNLISPKVPGSLQSVIWEKVEAMAKSHSPHAASVALPPPAAPAVPTSVRPAIVSRITRFVSSPEAPSSDHTAPARSAWSPLIPNAWAGWWGGPAVFARGPRPLFFREVAPVFRPAELF